MALQGFPAVLPQASHCTSLGLSSYPRMALIILPSLGRLGVGERGKRLGQRRHLNR